ncbi:MAG: cellulase family glycosylhydrolase [Chloroflexi bacterium]|nr:cellulase family glycosylhydrolase [Chloroflexota bacterium]
MRKKVAIVLSTLLIVILLLSAVPFSTYGQTSTPAQVTTPTADQSQTPSIVQTPIVSETPVVSQTPGPGDQYFPETGFNVPAIFINYWKKNGGLPVFGYPISEAKVERNYTDGKDYLTQYFERNRFEYHPEFQGTPNEVLLGLLGVGLTRDRNFPTVDPFPNSPGKVYIEATKHSLSEPFLSYWQKNGSVAIYGYPISEPFNETNPTDGKSYLVQYFERNRFEYHPENQPPYDVLIGLLGRDYMELQSTVTAWGPPIPGGLTTVQPILKPAKPAAGGKFLIGPTVGDGMIVQAYYQNRDRIMSGVNDLGYDWVKQQVQWKDTENPKGTYYWDEIDNIVNSAQSRNVKVLLSIVKAPDWATGGKGGFPTDPQDLGDFMRAMAAHFKGRVGAYEIWNEYNLIGESGDINPGRYVELLKAAYIGIKSQDPNAVVVAGALTPTDTNDPLGKRAPGADGAIPDTLYLEQMYQYNDGEVRSYFDAMGSHPYGFNNPPDTKWPENPNMNPIFPLGNDGKPNYYNNHDSFYFRRLEEQRAIMEKYGDGEKQMWLTEYGWCSDYRPDGYGECRYVTPDQQGQYIVGAIQRSKKYYPWMGVMFLWNLNFSTFQEWFTGPSHFSILNGDWSPRPAYIALKNRPK